jgi:homoserine O-acetyltransferase
MTWLILFGYSLFTQASARRAKRSAAAASNLGAAVLGKSGDGKNQHQPEKSFHVGKDNAQAARGRAGRLQNDLIEGASLRIRASQPTGSTPMQFFQRRVLLFLCLIAARTIGAEYPAPVEADYVIPDFKFASGETLPELRIHYRTLGRAQKNARGETTNAVLITHGTTGSGAQFIRPEFAGELFGAGQSLDAAKFYIVVPDGIGHGKSSKPSDGLHAKFPRYGYRDMVEAQYRLLTDGLGINHARLVMGTSMGGMHTWLWGETHPEFMNALMPLASLPAQISGRNRVWRRMIIDAIRNDPAWNGGDYTTQPPSLRTAAQMLWLMSNNPVMRQKEAPTLAKTDEVLDKFVVDYYKTGDANDVLYALEASRDYDPSPELEKIRVPLLAINFADDLINPPELGILEREIKRVRHGRAVLVPMSEKTRGHGSHTLAALWKEELVGLLQESEKR